MSTKYGGVVEPFLQGGVMTADAYKPALKSIHDNAVKQVVDNWEVNPILGTLPPPVHKSESQLSRAQRSTLAQLRSGHCRLLESHKSRCNQATSTLCPECRFHRHTTSHLFHCPAAPTTLTVSSLWSHPVDAMAFLLTLPSFSSLIPPDPLLPPPPPPPPPDPPPDPPSPLPPILSPPPPSPLSISFSPALPQPPTPDSASSLNRLFFSPVAPASPSHSLLTPVPSQTLHYHPSLSSQTSPKRHCVATPIPTQTLHYRPSLSSQTSPKRHCAATPVPTQTIHRPPSSQTFLKRRLPSPSSQTLLKHRLPCPSPLSFSPISSVPLPSLSQSSLSQSSLSQSSFLSPLPPLLSTPPLAPHTPTFYSQSPFSPY